MRTRVSGQAASVDGEGDVESTLGGAGQIRTVDLLETSLQTVLGDGGEGGRLKREIQDGLVLRGRPEMENYAIKVRAGHLNRGGLAASRITNWLVRNRANNFSLFLRLAF